MNTTFFQKGWPDLLPNYSFNATSGPLLTVYVFLVFFCWAIPELFVLFQSHTINWSNLSKVTCRAPTRVIWQTQTWESEGVSRDWSSHYSSLIKKSSKSVPVRKMIKHFLLSFNMEVIAMKNRVLVWYIIMQYFP